MDKNCPICGWEDNAYQLRFARVVGPPNNVSLRNAQRHHQERLSSVETASYARDRGWRMLSPDDIEQPDTKAGSTWPGSIEALYYWRPTYFRAEKERSAR